MKYYVVGNRNKKTVYETERLVGQIDGHHVEVSYTINWRGAQFAIGVPSTKEEAKRYLAYMGYDSLREMTREYGVSTLFDVIMPSEDIPNLEMNDVWDWDLIDKYDQCALDYTIDCDSKEVKSKIEKYFHDNNTWDLGEDNNLEQTFHGYFIEDGIYYDEQD